MNYITTFVIITIIHCSWAIPKLKVTESKNIPVKPEEKLIKYTNKPDREAKRVIDKVPQEKSIIQNNIEISKSKDVQEKPAVNFKTQHKTKPLMGIDYGYFDASDSEELLSHEMHMLVPISENLSSIDWQCIAQVGLKVMTCLLPSNPMAAGYKEAYTAEDLYLQSNTIFSCVLDAVFGLSKCIHLTDMIPHSHEHDYLYTDEVQKLKNEH